MEMEAKYCKAAQYLFNGMSKGAVASRLNVTTETLRQWQKKDEFKAYRRELIEEHARDVSQPYRSAAKAGLAAMVEIFEDPSAENQDKIRALQALNMVDPETVAKSGDLEEVLSKVMEAISDDEDQED